jgi:two-component system chemotaxis response regulator CheB
LRRPDNLEILPSQSPFAVSLRAALTRRSAPRQTTVVAPPVRGPAVTQKPALIAIGSSTGGPAALPDVLRPLGDRITQPIVITQHMPAAFSQILVEHLGRHTPMPTVLATDGMPLLPGRIHVAPGGRHLLLVRQGDQVMCRLDDGPPESFCKPAVDPMLRSIIAIYGARALAVILTGMGQDGLLGCRALVAAGGTVLAQDEATSVVWGMPGAVAQAGLCQSVLPLKEIGKAILKVAGGGL